MLMRTFHKHCIFNVPYVCRYEMYKQSDIITQYACLCKDNMYDQRPHLLSSYDPMMNNL